LLLHLNVKSHYSNNVGICALQTSVD